jgi:iron complex transport system ATP-binding protein
LKVRVEGLSFKYKDKKVLDGLDLEAQSGSFCALLGANGAGKSTLIKCIVGILRPQNGAVFADEMDLLNTRRREKARIVGYVPQNAREENSGLNVFETVLSGRSPHMRGRMSSEDHDIALTVMESLALSRYATRPISQLSGGERQRVVIARTLAQRPRIMLLDEPASNLDMRYQQEILELIKELCVKRGITVLSTIHDFNSAIIYADQAVLLDEGKAFCSSEPARALDADNIFKIFGVNVNFARLDGTNYVIPKRKPVAIRGNAG